MQATIDPTPEDLRDPIFKAIWERIKKWDIDDGHGGCEATGNHAKAIFEAVVEAQRDYNEECERAI